MKPFLPAVHPASARAVGIVCNASGDPYSAALLQGAVQTLNQAGLHAITFGGGFPSAPLFLDEQGLLCPPASVGSLIVLASTLRSFDAELKQFSLRNPGMVSVGVNLPGAINIGFDDQAGVFQAIAHLVKRHDCKRIAFIAGPEESVDGSLRLAAYRFALEELGLTYDPTLVVRGDYEAQSGRDAVARLRQHRHDDFDAVLAANDLMAIGAIEALRAAGLSVPERVKVVGFDDLEEAAFVWPALSTVRQPMIEQGAAAAAYAIRRLSAQVVDTTPTLIPAPLVVRCSCGCGEREGGSRPSVLPRLTNEGVAFVEDALRGVIRKQLAARRTHREWSRLAEAVLCARDYAQLAAAMTDIVRLLKVQRFLLCSYTANGRLARVVLESSGRGVVFRSQSEPFPVVQLLPPAFLKTSRSVRLFIEPLEVAHEHLGYMVLEGELVDGIAPTELRQIVSAALSRIAMTRELRRVYSAGRKRNDVQPASSFPERGERDAEPVALRAGNDSKPPRP